MYYVLCVENFEHTDSSYFDSLPTKSQTYVKINMDIECFGGQENPP